MRLARLMFASSAIANIVFRRSRSTHDALERFRFRREMREAHHAHVSQGGTRCPQRVGKRLARLIFAPSAIADIVFGEADPPGIG
jgi:hypothetical protein